VTVITQNVDGLHAIAGSTEVIELHGNIRDNICFDCGRPALRHAEASDPPPRCEHCGGMLRPGVVWFGELLPEGALDTAVGVSESADLFFCIGTSSLVEPAASLPRYASASGRTVVQINPEPTSHDHVAQYVLRGKAGVVVPAVMRAAWPDGFDAGA
jgi:NAD-dependent deacetylase